MEDDPEAMVVLALELVDSMREVTVLASQRAKTYESAHDFHIHSNRSGATKNARKHRNALLREGEREVHDPSLRSQIVTLEIGTPEHSIET